MTRLWDRGEPLDSEVLAYTAGEDHRLDARLVPYDLRASAAHADMLHACGHLAREDHARLRDALAELAQSFERGAWSVTLEDEDAHTAIENRLVAAIGEAGKRIHLGRSRNDQVLAALRLWLKDALAELGACAEEVARALDALTERSGALAMPGYTHMQRAMPSTVGLWLGGYAAEIRDDARGLAAAARRADRNPLGSAAGFGVPVLRIDRAATTAALGFAETQEPVTAVQLSRGKAEATALFEAALLAQDLSRLSAEIVLFATAEFGFLILDSAITTGSSILPQKRNPDVFELVRGRAAEAWACLQEVVLVLAKLPSGYHRDYQLLKPPLFRGLDGVLASARILARVLPSVRFHAERLAAAMDSGMRLAERAYELVAKEGVPFRDAYRRVREEG